MTNPNVSPQKACLGIDVAKDTLQVCLLRQNGKATDRTFENSPSGHRKLLSWAKHTAADCSLHFCLEATGSYSEAVATYLAEQDQFVSVINPARIHFFGRGLGRINKTDKADARLIALYCQQQNPPLWRMATAEVKKLQALVRLQQDLIEIRTQQFNRLATPGLDATVVKILKTHLQQLEADLAEVEAALTEHIKNTPSLKADRDLLVSIIGIGKTTASIILAELPEVSQFAQASGVGVYAGLCPREYRSGTSVAKRTRLSKQGNARLRAALYLPALTAIVWNPVLKAFYERLVANGKAKRAALGAVMRKLLMIAYGVLKSRKKFVIPGLDTAEKPA